MPVRAVLHKADGSGDVLLQLEHTLNHAQIRWLRAGSALNEIAAASAKRAQK